jgi:methylmalonyl-CoA epimerase
VSVTRIHHTGLVVRSIQDAYAFYRDTLSMRLVKEAVMEDQGVKAALFDMGNSFLELLEPIDPDFGIARFLETRGEGLHHVCLEVADIHASLAELKSKNVDLIDEEPRAGLTGDIAFIHPKSLHGVLVELVHGPTALRIGE